MSDRIVFRDDLYSALGRATGHGCPISTMLINQTEYDYDLPPINPQREWWECARYPIKHSYVKTSFANYLDLTPADQMVSFMPVARIPEGADEYSMWRDTRRQKMKPARLARAVLTDEALEKVTPKDFEEFANHIKAYCERDQGHLDIVSGTDIAEWYRAETTGAFGSCMQGEHDSFFDLYVYNPQVSMMIMANGDDELIGRALIWTLDDGTKYLDRIYGPDHMRRLFLDHAKDELGIDKAYDRDSGYNGDMHVVLDRTYFDYYPYCDTFRYIVDGKGLYSDDHHGHSGTLTSTSGGRDWACQECGYGYSYESRLTDVDGRMLCRECTRERLCEMCEQPKEDNGFDYCDECRDSYTCQGCGDVDNSTDESSYCHYCRGQYTCQDCGTIDHDEVDNSTKLCESCLENYQCTKCGVIEWEGSGRYYARTPKPLFMDDLCESCANSATSPEGA